MNIAQTLLSRGEDDAVALLQKDAGLTYRELRQNVARLAAGLLARGHCKGARIGLWSENNFFFVTGYLGILRAGLVAVPFQTEITEPTFVRIVADAGITEILVSPRFLNRLRPWAEKAEVVLLTEADIQNAPGDPTQQMPDVELGDLAALMFTSGSTGEPKGVMVSHRNIDCNTRDIIDYMGLTPEDRVMVVLPFHYCFGASLLHTHLLAGGSMVLNNEFMYPETVVKEMLEKECTGLAGVPSTYQILLRKSRFRELAFPKLRWLQQAGGKLPDPFIREILQSFPALRYYLMYGQTEATARLSYLPPARLVDKLGSIGMGLPSTHLEVLKPDGSPVTPGSGETGEIVATGTNITLGYWNDPVETARHFRDGKLHTGDIARVDGDGFIFIVELERDFIKSGGNRVSSKEVLDVIVEMPAVVEAAVLGFPHDLLGEAIHAFVVVVRGAGLVPDDVQAYCRRRLPPNKVPAKVVFIDKMPHHASGKVWQSKLMEIE
jgi:acyl-CoA synthetase (AMP-forming)/AMP-acid ligase II